MNLNLTTWNVLCNGDFVVDKSTQAFCNLFTDQALEQEIKVLKKHGALPGITQDESVLNRFMTTVPTITWLVQNYLTPFESNHATRKEKDHYQLSGEMCIRSSENAFKLMHAISLPCEVNPFEVNTPLKNIVSSAMIPENIKPDILNYPSLGQHLYEKFVEERLLPNSKLSVWDRITRSKFKTFSTWNSKSKIKVGDKVIKLREDRELIGRCLIIIQSRPGLLPRLEDTIGSYEMSVMPRSMFSPDGTLLLTADKASLMHTIEAQEFKPVDDALQHSSDSLVIIDAMAVIQAMKKLPGMTRVVDLKRAFINCTKGYTEHRGYSQTRVIFDQYLDESLKDKTRAKRATSQSALNATYKVHDDMSIKIISLRDLMLSPTTKSQIARLFGESLLKEYDGHKHQLIVTYDTNIKTNSPNNLEEEFTSHGHEEADTQIPLHVLHSIKDCAFRNIVVVSPDTDVLVLLMDLAANGHLGALTNLTFQTGKGTKFRNIDVIDRVRSIGIDKSKALIGLHNFTGADWGGKFVGISKKRWITEFLKLNATDPIVEAFQRLGELNCAQELVDGNLPAAKSAALMVHYHFQISVGIYSGQKTWNLNCSPQQELHCYHTYREQTLYA